MTRVAVTGGRRALVVPRAMRRSDKRPHQENIIDRRIERLTKRRGAETVPRAVASVTPVNSPLQEPRSLPLAVLFWRKIFQ